MNSVKSLQLAIEKFNTLDGEARLREFHRLSQENVSDPESTDWINTLLPYLHIQSASPAMPHPSTTFTFTVQPSHCSGLGSMHGGCTATLFDYCTSMVLTLISRRGYWSMWGVSRTLNTTYLRPALVGDEVLIECEVVGVGQRLCSLKGTMRRKSDGAVLATCEHGKVNTDPPESKM